ncbi:MAG: TonB-dependent receptor [Cytophagia bacterium]|nr:TonB-dependent receptor [Cytophagia bacterium]
MSTPLFRLFIASLGLLATIFLASVQGQPAPKSPSTSFQGLVVDPQGRALAGATLFWEGTNRGTTANHQGEFVLVRPETAKNLVVRYVGYQTLRMLIASGSQADSSTLASTLRVITLQPSVLLREEVVVTAGHVLPGTPVTSTRMDADELRKQNTGQDMPYVLQFQPSTLASSDAGAGIGYTNLRIRGSDMTRINVTLNGVPVNDAESHGLFWVNMPDLTSSLSSVQIQRGLGSSTNGSSAFGASIHLETHSETDSPGIGLRVGGGSFGTQIQSFTANTLSPSGAWSAQVRASRIHSDGYVDRSGSQLYSLAASLAYKNRNTIHRWSVLSGREKTGQAWYGLAASEWKDNPRFNYAGMFTNDSGQTAFYPNQTDNYRQDHWQYSIKHQRPSGWSIHNTFFYTRGYGYYEEYAVGQALADYGLPPVRVGNDSLTLLATHSDLIRQRWLDNHFVGQILQAQYRGWTLGAQVQRYTGWHFGRVQWTRVGALSLPEHEYYRNRAVKSEVSAFAKKQSPLSRDGRLQWYGDLQLRGIHYQLIGEGGDGQPRPIEKYFNFLNPKTGLHFQANDRWSHYAYLGFGHREPVRDDFANAYGRSDSNLILVAYPYPRPERMANLEYGSQYLGRKTRAFSNFYWMEYRSQLLLTGRINDVGAYTRVNVPRSRRLGWEFQIEHDLNSQHRLHLQGTLSRNRVDRFIEFVNNQFVAERIRTPLALSPEQMLGAAWTWKPRRNLEVLWNLQWVGRQYLDNSGDLNRSIDPYTVHQLQIQWNGTLLGKRLLKSQNESLQIRIVNLLNHQYVGHGYTFGYLNDIGEPVTDSYVFPQAPRYYLLTYQLGL